MMFERREIPVTSLLLDSKNPRLAQGRQNQVGAIDAMLQSEGKKTLELAASIAEEGLSPMERLLVMASPESTARYIVLEGNRRLTALKILEQPALAEASLTPAQMRNLKKCSSAYMRHGVVDKVECVVFPDREKASPWIKRRHLGEQGGVGVVSWGGTEAARFDALQSGNPSRALQVLDYVANHASLDEATRDNLHNFPISTLDRILADKFCREALGLEIDREQNVQTFYPEEEAIKGLRRIVRDLALKSIKVADVYNAERRRAYLGKFRNSELPDPATRSSDSRLLVGEGQASGTQGAGTRKAKTRPTRPRSRTKLIPRSCTLQIEQARISEISGELRELKLEDFTNAVAVLFRVFLELSVDQVIKQNRLMSSKEASGAKLRIKMIKVAEHLKGMEQISTNQFKAVKKAASDQQFLSPSLQTLHQYVHNPHFSPSPTDLRASWDSLQTYFEAMWPNQD